MIRSKSDNAKFLLSRYVRGVKVSHSEKTKTLTVTNYKELTSEAKVGLTTFVQDCPNVVRATEILTKLRIV